METTTLPPDTEVPSKRADLPAIWQDYRTQLAKIEETARIVVVTDVSQKAEMKLARDTRLTLKNLRVAIEKRRKELGEEALRAKQGIDRDAKALADAIEPLEARLLEQEQFAERAEQKRLDDLAADRVAKLGQFTDVSAYRPNALAAMTEDAFALLLSGAENAHKAKLEAAAKAEQERITKEKAEAEERERVRLENERLKAEAAEREAALKAERERVAAEQKAAAEAARKEREAIEARAKAEREAAEARAAEERRKAAEALAAEKKERERIEAEKAKELAVERAKAEAARKAAEEKARKEREEAEAKAAEERAAREKAEAELRAKREAEEAELKAKELAAKKAVAAPDKQKLAAFAATVRALTPPACNTEDGKKAALLIADQITKFAVWVDKQEAAL